MRRMLIVGLLAEKVEVPRLNEGVARQLGITSISEKIGEELKAFLQDGRAQACQGQRLGEVVKVDAPGHTCVFQIIIDGAHRISAQLVVHVTV